MISQLRGTLREKTPPVMVVDVQGVGYEVFAPMSTFYHLPELEHTVTLYTHHVVREDAQQLYGFYTRADRELFRTLIKVNGVGPKMALGILSGMEANDLVHCVQADNIAALTKIPGVGRKTAERLIIELRDKLTHFVNSADVNLTASGKISAPINTSHPVEEAESALAALGYKPAEASRMVSAAAKENAAASSQELIRLALRAAVKI